MHMTLCMHRLLQAQRGAAAKAHKGEALHLTHKARQHTPSPLRLPRLRLVKQAGRGEACAPPLSEWREGHAAARGPAAGGREGFSLSGWRVCWCSGELQVQLASKLSVTLLLGAPLANPPPP